VQVTSGESSVGSPDPGDKTPFFADPQACVAGGFSPPEIEEEMGLKGEEGDLDTRGLQLSPLLRCDDLPFEETPWQGEARRVSREARTLAGVS